MRIQPVLLAMIASALAATSLPQSANAAHPCTGASGEVQVGEDNGVPLCEQHGTGAPGASDSPADKPRFPGKLRMVDTFYAVAFHAAANDPWAIWKNQISLKNAQERVLAACNTVMGRGCRLVGSGANSFGVLGYRMDQPGGPQLVQLGVGRNLKEARQNLKNKCRAKGYECSPLDFFGTIPERDNAGVDFSITYFPTKQTVKRRAPAR